MKLIRYLNLFICFATVNAYSQPGPPPSVNLLDSDGGYHLYKADGTWSIWKIERE